MALSPVPNVQKMKHILNVKHRWDEMGTPIDLATSVITLCTRPHKLTSYLSIVTSTGAAVFKIFDGEVLSTGYWVPGKKALKHHARNCFDKI
mmetsp:Transcript_86483/g.222792  ORF Transcript_86483/g.222792 Transcript_86483/m.222792 type:complete len:92 (+) Transcript_86483:122-397(+)|eukprot:CAMPEP_0195084902 /NCGR_PEP_ID=MMETSP0448-20130528/25474_1 /TAXON_ID=66468 /ORGANISM="Heterocapsa triquestra, Strain CCMP 448" /LENGTH=91 /DNA_ID=CAMNT_0040118269 /DNA_START=112 /DNA_END=390 /DNA_ORIENTATION=-